MRGGNSSPYKARALERTDDYYKNMYLAAQDQRRVLQEELAILRSKNKKVLEVEENVDMVLEHNKKLLSQNEKLSKAIHQKKAEVDTWKSKHDALQSTRMGQSSSHELQIKKLLNEIDRLKEECAQIEHLKNLQINDIKNQNHLELQNLKRTNMSASELGELEIRKLKELIDKKEYEIDDLNVRLNRAYNQSEFQILKLKEEKDRLRSQISFLQNEKRKEIDAIRLKLDHQHQSDIESMRKTNGNHLQALEFENLKLKDVINAKNLEIESLITKNQKLKNNYEETISMLKRENEGLKEKFFQNEKINEAEFETLKEKMLSMHEAEIEVLKRNHHNLAEALQNEIAKLQTIITAKNHQTEQLLKEKSQTRLSFEAELARMRNQIDTQKLRNAELENSSSREVAELNDRLKARDARIEQLQENGRADRQKASAEARNLQNLLDKKSKDYDALGLQTTKTIRELQHKNSMQGKKLQDAQNEIQKTSKNSGDEVGQAREQMKQQEKRFMTRIEGLTGEVEKGRQQAARLQELCDQKDGEVEKAQKRAKAQEDREKKLKKELDEQKQIMISENLKHAQNLDELKRRLEGAHSYSLKSTNKQNENSQRVLQLQVKELNELLSGKGRELQQLLRRYQMLEDKFNQVANQEANRRQLDLKLPATHPDILAWKNIFDIYLKTKIIDVCPQK